MENTKSHWGKEKRLSLGGWEEIGDGKAPKWVCKSDKRGLLLGRGGQKKENEAEKGEMLGVWRDYDRTRQNKKKEK